MFDFDIDITHFISPSLRQRCLNTTLNTLNKVGKTLLSEQTRAQLSTLSTDSTFQLAFEQALQRGADRFVQVHLDEDEDLVEAIVDYEGFFGHEQVQEAFLSILQEPSRYVADGQEMVIDSIHSFDCVLPRRRNRRRVNRAMSVFLSCLAQDVWNLPQLRAAYETILDQTAADTLAQPIYQNLPQPDYERFVGRKPELAQVQELLSPTARHFAITIDGIGGIGKSALALEVAHRYRRDVGKLPPAERFEAIIWATAKQSLLTGQGIITRTQSLRTLDDIYSTIATTLEREDITRARSEEQDDIVRRALTEQRTLLIIDNLETVDDKRVMTFIRHLPAPTKAIITTRHRLNVAYPIRLVGMSHNEALELTNDESKRKHITLTHEQATRLHKRTGGVPLAIVWSIAQMGFGHGIEATLTRLGQPTSDIAQFCFQGAIHLIQNTPAHHLLMALSLFATDASRDALGYVAELPVLDRDDGLEELERLSLVNKEDGRFVLLPLTKVYSEEELGKDGELEERFRGRLVEFLLNFLTQKRCDKHNTVDDVIPELDNIIQTMNLCWQNYHLEVLLDLIAKTDFYLWATGKWNTRHKFLKLGLEVGKLLKKELVQANYLRRLADMADFQGDLAEALELIDQALAIYQSYEANYQLVLSYYRLSSIQAKQKKWDIAKDTANLALLIAKRLGNDNLITRIEGRLGKNYLIKGDYQSAKDHLIRAIKLHNFLFEYGKEDWAAAWLYRMYGQVLLAEEDYELSRQYLSRSLEIAQRARNKQEMAETKGCIAQLHFAIGDLNAFRETAKEAIQLFTQLRMKRQIKETQALLDEIAAQRKHDDL